VECVCANARVSVLGVPRRAQGLKGEVVTQEQELAHRRRAWRHGEARVAAVRRGGRRGEAAQGLEGGGKAGE
jgi:hypothetical protein